MTRDHLPQRLTITLWDFSWYTRAASGEPFDDLDAAFAAAADRGYNTVRICAMTSLLFGDSSDPAQQLSIEPMAPGVGAGTRWYNVQGGYTIDARQRLLDLFAAARRHDMYIIVSSWEYQQSPAFSSDDEWYRRIEAIEPEDRFLALARALERLVGFLRDRGGLDDRIAYLELHNEVDLSRLREVNGGHWHNAYVPQKALNEEALTWLREACPDHLVTTSYGITPYLDMDVVAQNVDVAHFHVYVYGTLSALERQIALRAPDFDPSSPELRRFLVADAPTSGLGTVDTVPAWRWKATSMLPSMFFTYDNCDVRVWDRWLYQNDHLYAEAMRWAIDDKLVAVSAFAAKKKVPAVIGEGWTGYTPVKGDYEDGPLGTAINEFAVSRARELGYWGAVAGSNFAPHHPAWTQVEWQQKVNRLFLDD